MSDRQKGLLKALDHCVPEASSRYCWETFREQSQEKMGWQSV